MSKSPHFKGWPYCIRDLEQSYAAEKTSSISGIARELAAREAAEQVGLTARLSPLAVLMSPLQRLIGCSARFSQPRNSSINIRKFLQFCSLMSTIGTSRAQLLTGRAGKTMQKRYGARLPDPRMSIALGIQKVPVDEVVECC